jgi:hypothetical protein
LSKYRHLERPQDGKHKVATLVPFIAESTGALTPTVLSTLRHMSNSTAHPEFLGCSSLAFRHMKRVIAFLIQRGNAKVIQEGLRRASPVPLLAPSARHHLRALLRRKYTRSCLHHTSGLARRGMYEEVVGPYLGIPS